MLENYNKFNFTELDFMIALIHELRKRGITSFNKAQLEEELFAYHNKYLILFLDIDCHDNRLHLDESIGILTITGEIYDISPNFDKKFIRGKLELKEDIEYQPYYEEISKLVEEYITRKKVENDYLQKKKIRLKIYGINPNQKYTLINGSLGHDEEVSHNLITSGKIIRGEIKSSKYSMVSIEIPNVKNREWSYLKDIEAEEIEVLDAEFVAIQGSINEEVKTIDLYCESTSEEELYTYAGISSTKEVDKNIQVLSLRKR